MKKEITISFTNPEHRELLLEKRLACYKQLGLKIAYFRKSKGLTQLQLAEMVDISRTYMSNIEAPKSIVNPTLDVVFDIANSLDVPVSKLFESD